MRVFITWGSRITEGKECHKIWLRKVQGYFASFCLSMILTRPPRSTVKCLGSQGRGLAKIATISLVEVRSSFAWIQPLAGLLSRTRSPSTSQSPILRKFTSEPNKPGANPSMQPSRYSIGESERSLQKIHLETPSVLSIRQLFIQGSNLRILVKFHRKTAYSEHPAGLQAGGTLYFQVCGIRLITVRFMSFS